MKALYKKLRGREAPENISPIWLGKQIDWYGQSGKKWEKEIRQLLALDIKKKTTYQSGTKLVREYESKRHEVLILDSCFIYEGVNYKSLSKIAEEITGTRWNGNLFFNVRRT